MQKIQKYTVISCLLTFILSGCLKDLSLKDQGLGIGALVGGATAYLTCKLDGNSSKECRKSAAIGFVAGGIAGALFGKSMEERRKAYATDEELYDASIESLQQINIQLSDERTSIDQQIAAAADEMNSLINELSTAQYKTEQFQDTRRKTLTEKRKLDERIAEYRNEFQVNQNILADSRKKSSEVSAELAAEIARLQEEIAALDGKSLELASISSVTF